MDDREKDGLSSASFRAALQCIHALRDDPPTPRIDRFFLSGDWYCDWEGIRENNQALFDSMVQSTQENGDCTMPLDVWQSLVERGYLVRVP